MIMPAESLDPARMVPISVVIPSYMRGAIVLDTIRALRVLDPCPAEIIVVDQTPEHPDDVALALAAEAAAGNVRWEILSTPSIPAAMNRGIELARSPRVLFLDDDILPDPALLAAHNTAAQDAKLVAGQVLQPGQRPRSASDRFGFDQQAPARIKEFMGGNFCIDRAAAYALGGFDEHFEGAAYRFEAEFAARYTAIFGDIVFRPEARIYHLAIPTGGTRAGGHHFSTASPHHSLGEYYFLLRQRPKGWRLAFIKRPLRAIRTRHHLRRPWWIPLTFVAEIRGMRIAWNKSRQPPALPLDLGALGP